MLAFDIVAAVIAVGLLFVGLALFLWKRSKTLKGRERQTRWQGVQNRHELMFGERTRCQVCDSQTSPEWAVLGEDGCWYHTMCLERLGSVTKVSKKVKE